MEEFGARQGSKERRAWQETEDRAKDISMAMPRLLPRGMSMQDMAMQDMAREMSSEIERYQTENARLCDEHARLTQELEAKSRQEAEVVDSMQVAFDTTIERWRAENAQLLDRNCQLRSSLQQSQGRIQELKDERVLLLKLANETNASWEPESPPGSSASRRQGGAHEALSTSMGEPND